MRKSNIELLRIILMIMVIMCHLFLCFNCPRSISDNNIIVSDGLGGFLGWTADSCFVVISCWFLIDKKFNFRRFCYIWFEVFIYSMLFLIINISTRQLTDFSFQSLIKYFMPIIYPPQSFVGLYLLFLLIQPFLYALDKRINYKSKLTISILIFSLYSLWKFFYPLQGFANIFIHQFYIIGLYFLCSFFKEKRPLFIYKKSILLTIFISVAIIYFVTFSGIINSKRSNFYNMLFYFDNVFCTASSFSLFFLFNNLNIKDNKVINFFSKFNLGVLLLHSNDLSNNIIFRHVKIGHLFTIAPPLYILLIFSTAIVIYLFCSFFDLLRYYVQNVIFNLKPINDVFRRTKLLNDL